MADKTGVSDLNQITSLIQGIQFDDPRLYQALMLIAKDIGLLVDDLAPIKQFVQPAIAPNVIVPDVQGFAYLNFPTYIKFTWAAPTEDFWTYELRKGSDWTTAERLVTTNTLQALVNPIVAGTTRYLIKAIDRYGNFSANPTALDVVVTKPGRTTLSAQVIDNNVLLSWTKPDSTFDIAYYIVKKDGVEIGRVNGTFALRVESTAGTFTYSIIPVDLAGNQCDPSDESWISIDVKAPPDYTMISSLTSALTGTKVNCLLDDDRLLFCIDTARTWAQHFSDRGWTTIQNQIDAGYPYYYQPAGTSGSYQEVFDFGAVYQNCIVSVNWANFVLVGAVSFTCQIEVSDDGVTYGAPVTGTSVFAASLRYARVTVNAAATDDALNYLYNLQVMLNVKQEVDSGSGNALSTDSAGTVVNFNKGFKFVNSITLTSVSGEPVNFVYQFDGGANPDHFHVFAFDSSGNRITKDFSWKARGVV